MGPAQQDGSIEAEAGEYFPDPSCIECADATAEFKEVSSINLLKHLKDTRSVAFLFYWLPGYDQAIAEYKVQAATVQNIDQVTSITSTRVSRLTLARVHHLRSLQTEPILQLPSPMQQPSPATTFP